MKIFVIDMEAGYKKSLGGNSMRYSGTQGTTTSIRICGGQQVVCDGHCWNCNRAEVLYSTMNQTSTYAGINIVRRPSKEFGR